MQVQARFRVCQQGVMNVIYLLEIIEDAVVVAIRSSHNPALIERCRRKQVHQVLAVAARVEGIHNCARSRSGQGGWHIQLVGLRRVA